MSTDVGQMEHALHVHAYLVVVQEASQFQSRRKTLHVVKQEAQRWHSKIAQSNRLSGIG